MESKYKIIAELSIIPIGTRNTSIGEYIAMALFEVSKINGLEYNITPMGTILEADDLQTIYEAVNRAHKSLFRMGISRVETTLRIDERKDKPRSMNDKVDSVKKRMKKL